MQNPELNKPENFPPSSFGTDHLNKAFQTPTPNNPPWGSPVAFLVLAASLLFILLLPNLFVAAYLFKTGADFSNPKALEEIFKTDVNANIFALIAIIPAHVLTLVLAWAVVTKFKKFSFRRTLGWNWGGFKIWHIILIVAFFFALAASLVSIFGEQDNDLKRILSSSRTAVYLVAFFATFTAPLVEEVVYRGVLYSALQRSLGVIYAVVLVTLVFALIHVPQYHPDYVSISLICLLSLVLTLVRVWTGNLLPCIVLHTVFNGIQSLMLVAEPFFREQIKQTPDPAFFFTNFLK